jgi:hypothetical protein
VLFHDWSVRQRALGITRYSANCRRFPVNNRSRRANARVAQPARFLLGFARRTSAYAPYLGLGGRPDDDVAHIHIGRLFDRKRNGAGNRIR